MSKTIPASEITPRHLIKTYTKMIKENKEDIEKLIRINKELEEMLIKLKEI